MHLSSLINKRKKIQRMLNICKQKQLACSLYLKEEPENVSRTMLRYLADLESEIDDHYLDNQQAFSAFGIVLALLLIVTLIPLRITFVYFFALFIFLVLIFVLPYYTSRRHIMKTKEYIRTKELPTLKKKAKLLQKQLESINQHIEEELRQSRKKSAHSSEQRRPKSKQALTKTQALAVLGLPPEATFEQAKKAYRKKILTFHPDKSSKMDEKQRLFSEKETIRLNQAYTLLKKVMR